MLNTRTVAAALVATVVSLCVGQNGAVDTINWRYLPEEADALAQRQALVEQRLQGLQTELTVLQAAEPPAPEQLARVQARFDAWSAYRDVVTEAISTQQTIATATARTDEIAQQIEQIKAQTEAIRKRTVGTANVEEQLTAIRAELNALDARLGAVNDAQQRRVEFRSHYETRRNDLQQQVVELTQTVRSADNGPTTDAGAETPAPPTPAGEVPVTEIRLATAELRQQLLPLQLRRATVLYELDEALLEALNAQKEALTDWEARLAARQARKDITQLEQQVAGAATEAELVKAQLDLFVATVRQEYLRDQPKLVLTKDDLAKPLERLAALKSQWEATKAALDYELGRNLQRLQRELDRDLQNLRRRLQERRQTRADAMTQQSRLRELRELILRKFDELAVEARGAIEDLRERNVITELRSTLETELNTLQERASVTRSNAEELVNQTRTTIDTLLVTENALRLTRIERRTSGFLGVGWAGVGSELASFARPPEDAVEPLFQLDDARQKPRERLINVGATLEQTLNRLGGRPGWYVIGSAALALVLGTAITILARRRSVPLARQIESHYREVHRPDADGQAELGSGVAGRFNLLVLNLIGDLMIVWLLTVVILSTAWWVGSDPILFRLSTVIVGGAALTATVVRVIHHLFEAASAPHRPLPCADAVAAHYRHWLVGLLLFAAVIMIPVVALQRVDILPQTRDALSQIFKLGLLIGLLIFLYRKQFVLGLLAEVEPKWLRVIADVMYPIFMLAIFLLAGLQLAGFGYLVTYVGTGVGVSITILLGGLALSEYLVDLVIRSQRYAGANGARPPQAGRRRVRVPKPPELSPYLRGLIKGLIRLLIFIGAVYAILLVWDVELDGDRWDWQVASLAAVTLLVGLVVDRLVIASATALERGGTLPDSTSRFLQRVARTVIVILVLLALGLLAGLEVMGLWTFLSTLLAMVAIGFVAVWSILSNVLATLVILIWRPFNVGEWIEIKPEDIGGQVVDINFIYTILRTDDDRRIAVPNNLFAQKFISRKVAAGKPRRTLADQLEKQEALGD